MSHSPTYLFVVPWRVTEVGGVNQVVLNLYRQFEAAGTYSPRIWVTFWNHTRPSTVRENGRSVTYMRVRAPLAAGMPGASGKWAVSLLPELLRIRRYLQANDVVCVNVHYPSLAALQFVLAGCTLARRPKMILSFHGLDLTHAVRATGLERWMWKFLLRRADAVVSCSNAHTRSVLAFDPSIGTRASTVHNGVDMAWLMNDRKFVAPIDARLLGRQFILSVASYEPKKGLDTLLFAFKCVREIHRIDVVLALVGPDLGMGNDLGALAIEIGVSDHVVFCGEVPHRDLRAYYGAARVFCLPSRAEPFGIVLLEAGVFRCPVVATTVGGIPEILKHDVNACLVPPDDPAALAAQLTRLLLDRKTSDRHADALYEHVIREFRWEKAYRSYMRLVGQYGTARG